MTSRLPPHRALEAAAGIRGVLVQKGLLKAIGAPVSDEVLEELLRQEKILLARVALSDKVSAVYMRSDPYALILLNCTSTVGHQRFSLVHELCHHFLHTELNTWACPVAVQGARGHEREANQFAAAFLLPARSVCDDFFRLMDETNDLCRSTIEICERYRTSWQSTVGRLRDLSLIGKHEQDALLESKVMALARKYEVSLDLFRPSGQLQIPAEFAELARDLRERAVISERKYQSLMDDLEALMECGHPGVEVSKR
ncbi:MAG TPA: ImmA/IrrE family metallo-endopeptidase [Firmicutes bacterium]|jgi:Zn-dependent peptidase ImmA (M78 family)|nr:ImmA/IrrE family metallo-endopeptidase [Candidatus Fermentithermobacillaceae bacterium]